MVCVSKIDWHNWDIRTDLALLMRDGERCGLVLMNFNEASRLLKKIDPAQDGQKKINVRIPAGAGQIYIQEWQSFKYQARIIKLGTVGAEPKLTYIKKKSLRDLQILDRVKDAISKMTASEKKRFLDEIKN